MKHILITLSVLLSIFLMSCSTKAPEEVKVTQRAEVDEEKFSHLEAVLLIGMQNQARDMPDKAASSALLYSLLETLVPQKGNVFRESALWSVLRDVKIQKKKTKDEKTRKILQVIEEDLENHLDPRNKSLESK